MVKTNLEIIKDVVGDSKSFPHPTIEYNFDEIPTEKGITKTKFFGVKAIYNPNTKLNTAHVIYKY